MEEEYQTAAKVDEENAMTTSFVEFKLKFVQFSDEKLHSFTRFLSRHRAEAAIHIRSGALYQTFKTNSKSRLYDRPLAVRKRLEKRVFNVKEEVSTPGALRPRVVMQF